MNVPDEPAVWIPPRPEPRWTLRIVGALVVVAALVLGGLKVHDEFVEKCDDGLRKRGPADECIGVTDGSYTFEDQVKPQVSEVIGKIHQANQEAEASNKKVVQIAYAEPLTLGDGADRGWRSLRQGLQGAYLAQKKLNDGSGHGDNPKIKLLLANPGRDANHWEPMVDQLLGMRNDDPPLVGVTGLGQSLENTKRIVESLRERDVPTVGSTVTADQLSDETEGFFRIAQPNSYQAAAMARHLRDQQRNTELRVHLIEDTNEEDIYSKSLRKGFRSAAEAQGLDVGGEYRFTSRENSTADTMAGVAGQICPAAEEVQRHAVYFAGRGRDLREFLDAAAERECRVDVYAGDDTLGVFYNGEEEELAFPTKWRANQKDAPDGGIKVKYTALTHPKVMDDEERGQLKTQFTKAFEPSPQLENGQVMIGYDATWALGKAARKAFLVEANNEEVAAVSVKGVLRGMDGKAGEEGLSGSIEFDRCGNPTPRPLPLVELRPRGKENERYAYRGELRKVESGLNEACELKSHSAD
ncbi:ABC transporter substrate-binding protein [Streptomyces oceani]|uniref:ABC transporter substrate-binding protein n=1 Tax=Streptomyces oceani TaxID=1075402 RepID=UPI001112C8E8|nr:ABC transporter substrate-binding protein [Streptomyces oceani]